MLTDELLTQIENAYRGRSSAGEQKEFSDLMDNDPPLKEEIQLYHKIWDAFDALKSHRQAQLFQEWEKDWKETDEEELIEWLLDGSLGEESAVAIQYEKDTAFAQKVNGQKSLLEGFSAVKSSEFREKMNSWETSKKEAKPIRLRTSWRRPLSIAASFLLLITASFGLWKHQGHSNASLIEKYSSLMVTGNTMSAGDESDDYLKSFDEAQRLLKQKNYSSAVKAFQSLSQQPYPSNWNASSQEDYDNKIDWSLILSLLGNGQTDDAFMEKLGEIANDAEHDYREKAQGLMDDLNSFWRF